MSVPDFVPKQAHAVTLDPPGIGHSHADDQAGPPPQALKVRVDLRSEVTPCRALEPGGEEHEVEAARGVLNHMLDSDPAFAAAATSGEDQRLQIGGRYRSQHHLRRFPDEIVQDPLDVSAPGQREPTTNPLAQPRAVDVAGGARRGRVVMEQRGRIGEDECAHLEPPMA